MTEREQEVLAEIQRILAAELEVVEPVAALDLLADCEALDSLGLLTLAVGLEDRFRIKLSAAQAPSLATFIDVIHLVNRQRDEVNR